MSDGDQDGRHDTRSEHGKGKSSNDGGSKASGKSNYSGKLSKDSFWQPGEVGYCRPPIATRFVKGQSGNPGGRPRKPAAAKQIIDLATRDTILEVAARPIATGHGRDLPAFKAVLLKQLETALKGHPIAQKHIVDLIIRCNAEHDADRSASDKLWDKYKTVMSGRLAVGEVLSENFPHPDDVIFEDGHFVGLLGGDPIEATRNRGNAIRMRDLQILMAELNRRIYQSRTKVALEPVQFLPFVYVIWLNDTLPARLQLTDNDLTSRIIDARGIRKRDLIRQPSRRIRRDKPTRRDEIASNSNHT